MLKQRLPRKLSNIKVSQFIRDGPLEKLWGGGKGNCRAPEIFLRYQIPCMNFFLGLIGVQEFFSFNFPLRELFFVLRPPPPP